MQHQINKIELVQLNNGKVKKSATLSTNGVITENVTIWPDFLNFATLAVGQFVEGDLKTQPNGKYINHTLYAPSSAVGTQQASNRSFTPARGGNTAISKAQEVKRENINEALDKKEFSIKVASTMNKAVELAIAEYTRDGGRPLDELVVKWRHWLWLQWEKVTSDSIAPF